MTTVASALSAPAWSAGSRSDARERLERLSWLLDSALRIPGTRIRVGADAVLGMVPGLGNATTTLVSAYLIHEAWRLGIPRAALARMIANVAVDGAVTMVPVLGTLADLFWRANRRNMAILARHLDQENSR